jgi:hypothetical protein
LPGISSLVGLLLVEVCPRFLWDNPYRTEALAGFRNEMTPEWADVEGARILNAQVRQIAREEEAYLIDRAQMILDLPEYKQPEKICYDGMHVHYAGSEIFGRLVADALLRDVIPHIAGATSKGAEVQSP